METRDDWVPNFWEIYICAKPQVIPMEFLRFWKSDWMGAQRNQKVQNDILFGYEKVCDPGLPVDMPKQKAYRHIPLIIKRYIVL